MIVKDGTVEAMARAVRDEIARGTRTGVRRELVVSNFRAGEEHGTNPGTPAGGAGEFGE